MEQKLYPSTTLSAPSAPYDNDVVESMIKKQLAKESSFNNSLQNIMMMMKYYEVEENKYKKKCTKYKLINNLIRSTDGLIIIGTTSASVALSISSVGVIVVPITAGVGCATGILVRVCSSYLKKKEQNYECKYTIIQKTLDDFRQLFITRLKDNHLDEKDYQRFVNMYENYSTASRAASHIASHTASQSESKKRDTTTSNRFYLYSKNLILTTILT